MNKKGSGFPFLKAAAIAFIVVTVLIAIGADITSDIQADHTALSAPHNITVTGLEAQQDLADNLTTIATVVGAVILLGFLGVKLFGKK